MRGWGAARLVLAALLIGGLLLGSSEAVGAAPTVTVVATGLDNPRGLSFGPLGALYVAEAGKGGSGPCAPSPEGEEVCLGATGAVTVLFRGQQRRVVTGLPSLATAAGGDATGPHDVSLTGPANLAVTIGLGGTAAQRAAVFGSAGARLGTVARVGLDGTLRQVVDLAAFEAANNPDGGLTEAGEPDPDSNPYGVLYRQGQRVVTDAGGNDLLLVAPDGTTSVLAVFPPRLVDAPPFLGLPPGAKIPMQSVPTTVALGPDNALYVGELTGFPFPKGAARVYRVVPGQAPTVVADGFTNIIDIAFAPDGKALYVLEIAKDGLLAAGPGGPVGALTRIESDGTRRLVLSEGLVAPGGVAVAADGTIYVTNNSTSAGTGQVLRITP